MNCSCGAYMVQLQSGGCGGEGALSGCPKCDVVFCQTTGGMFPTPGGPRYKTIPGTFFETRLRIVEQQGVRQCNWGDDKGKWFWNELNWGDYHHYDTKEEAAVEFAKYRDKIESEIPNPDCWRCGRKSRSMGRGTVFYCNHCNKPVDEPPPLHQLAETASLDNDDVTGETTQT